MLSLIKTPQHIRAARLKCGYCPSNGNGMKHSIIRHEVDVMKEDDEIDLDGDSLGEVLDIALVT